MQKILPTLPSFLTALDTSPNYIQCNDKGEWGIGSKLWMAISLPYRWLRGTETKRLIKIVEAVSTAFCELEKDSTIENSKKNTHLLNQCENTIAKVKAILSNHYWQTKEIKDSIKLLDKHRVTLLTRSKLKESKKTPEETLNKIKSFAESWKPTQKHLPTYVLTERDLNRLQGLKEFPLLAEELTKSSSLRDDFFKWIMQDWHEVRPYALFTGHCEKWIRKSLLSSRADHQEELGLKTVYKNGKWDLQIPIQIFDGKRKVIKDFSLLDSSKKICFGKNDIRTIEEIFKTFANKNCDVGDLEFLHYADEKKPAIARHHLHNLTFVNDQGEEEQIDLNDRDWFRKVPIALKLSIDATKKAFETPFDWEWWMKETYARFQDVENYASIKNSLENFKGKTSDSPPDWNALISAIDSEFSKHSSLKDLLMWLEDSKTRYEIRVDGKNWIEFGGATRKDLVTKDMEGAHGILGFGIPNEKGTEYHFFFIGKYAKDFPDKWWEKLAFFCGSHPATLEITDTNYDYTNRRFSIFSVLVHSESNVRKGLDRIRRMASYARIGKLAFQYQSFGCSEFPQTYINKQRKIVNLSPVNAFKVKCSKGRPKGFIGVLHYIARHCPFSENVQMGILFCFAPWRSHPNINDEGKVEMISYYNSEVWREKKTFMPSELDYKQSEEIRKVVRGQKIKKKFSLLPRGPLPDFLNEVLKQEMEKTSDRVRG